MSTTMQLHAALIWGGEPIADVVLAKPGPITIGPVASATFTVPDLGLPEVFPIVSAGERGYLLTMGNAMGGTVSVGGVRKRVTDLVGAAPFAATPVAAGDWGVVDLDASGALQLFFQVAPATETVPTRRPLDLETLLPASAFSVVLHLLLLIGTFGLYTGESPVVWPGPRSLTGNFLVSRIERTPTPPPITPSLVLVPQTEKDKPESPSQLTPPKKADVPARGKEGAKGGPKTRPDATDDISPAKAEVALNSRENRDLLRKLTNSPVDMDKWTRKMGTGLAARGDGDGAGGDELPPGTPKGDDHGRGIHRQGDLDTDQGAHPDGGHCRGTKCGHGIDPDGTHGPEIILPPPDKVILDDDATLDPRVIQERIKARQGLIRTCYQLEFNRNTKLGGRITTKFVIAPDGHVSSAKIQDSAMNNDAVESCVTRQLMKIKFPTSTRGAVVRYPFIFNGGK